MFDVWLMLLFGVAGYVFKKLDYPLAPLVLALVLGDRAEDAFRQAMLGSQGSMYGVLLQRPGRGDHRARARPARLADGKRAAESQEAGRLSAQRFRQAPVAASAATASRASD